MSADPFPITALPIRETGNAQVVTFPVSVPPMWETGNNLYADIASLLDGTMPKPPAPKTLTRSDGHAIFYAGQVNWVFGDPEGGKTWVCLAAVVETLNRGGSALVLDLDHNGPESTVARLVALGAPTEILRDPSRFRYSEPEDSTECLAVVHDMKDFEPTVVTVDSCGELLPLFGTSSNSADDFTTVHTRVFKPLAKTGATVLAVDHLAKGIDSRAQGPGGTAAKRRAIGGVSIRVTVKDAFTPGKGGSAALTINKDRHGGLREHCPTGDKEPFAGLFTLHAFNDDILEWSIRAPGKDERTATETAPDADVAAIAALDPPPTTVNDARQRLSWRTDRTSRAMKAWRESVAG